jgi:hypothetical protein
MPFLKFFTAGVGDVSHHLRQLARDDTDKDDHGGIRYDLPIPMLMEKLLSSRGSLPVRSASALRRLLT